MKATHQKAASQSQDESLSKIKNQVDGQEKLIAKLKDEIDRREREMRAA